MDAPHPNPRPLLSAAATLGIGLGGFLDGILLHQLLQTHNMLSAKRPKTSVANMEINMFWDGLFHAFTWLTTALGVYLLFRAARQPNVPWKLRILLGGMLIGWGLFNLVEGLLNHHLLHLHHVLESHGGVSRWDYLFLSTGLLFPALGYLLLRSASLKDNGGPIPNSPVL